MKRYTNDVNGDLECANDRITQLEALIRDVAIPTLKEMQAECRSYDLPYGMRTYSPCSNALIKLQKAIK